MRNTKWKSVRMGLILSAVFWVMDSFIGYHYFHGEESFLDVLIFAPPVKSLLVRLIVLGGFLAMGMILSIYLDSLTRARARAEDSEREKHQLKSKFEAVLATTSDAVIATDMDGNINLFNPGAEKLTGYSTEHAKSMHISELCHKDRRQELLANFRQVLETGSVQGVVSELVTIKGDRIPVKITLDLRTSKKGKPSGVNAILRDISDLIEAEAEVERLARFPEENPNPVLRVDSSGVIVYANKAAEVFLDTWECRVGECLDRKKGAAVYRAFDSEEGNSVEIACGKRIFTVAFAPIRKEGYVNIYGMDITELKQAEQLLAENEQRLRLAQEASLTGVWERNLATNQVYWSDNIAEIFGIEEGTFGKTYDDFTGMIHPDDRNRIKKEVFTALERSEGFVTEYRVIWPDGTVRWLQDKGDLFEDEKGNFSRLVGTVHDITDRKTAAEELRKANEEMEQRVEERTRELDRRASESERLNRAMVNLMEDLQEANLESMRITAQLETTNEELKSFAYSVSHDLRAPLRAIDGFSQALVEEYNDRLDDQGRDYLGRVRSGAEKMAALIDDLLVLSRASRTGMRRESVDLSSLAENIIGELRDNEPHRTVDVRIQPGIVAEVDQGLFRQVFRNLIGNAWKFTRNEKDALIEFGEQTDERTGERMFYIRDNGAGFDMQYAEKLFGAFQRLHGEVEFEGTGIGLAIVQRIMHRHNGKIWAQAEEGKGATF